MKSLIDKQLVLGSKSPRRSQLLTEAGFSFEVRIQDIDEDFAPDMPVLEVAENLAKRKAEALVDTLADNEVLITADSVVILNGIIYNKPANYDEGILMLAKLSDSTHTVATGVCIKSKTKSISFTVTTLVTFDNISKLEMDYYLVNHKPYDKAGGYGIQDWIGLCKVASIQGSYSNVMGLPIREVYQALMTF